MPERMLTAFKAAIDEEAWATLPSGISRSLDGPKSGSIAVKGINQLAD